jgi:uncharacterized phiE125 gp8 family phage protein
MASLLLSRPSCEVISLDDAKLLLKVEAAVVLDDDMIESIITAAVEYVERYTKRLLCRRSVTEYRDGWPGDGTFRLIHGPVYEFTTLSVLDGDGVFQPVDGSNYSADRHGFPGRVQMLEFPTIESKGLNRVRLEYTAGYDKDIVAPLLQAVRMLIVHWYQHGIGDESRGIESVHGLLRQYVIAR